MIKRILTVTLAAILALETPLTAYAAQTDPIPVEESEGTDSVTEETEENEGISGGGGNR